MPSIPQSLQVARMRAFLSYLYLHKKRSIAYNEPKSAVLYADLIDLYTGLFPELERQERTSDTA